MVFRIPARWGSTPSITAYFVLLFILLCCIHESLSESPVEDVCQKRNTTESCLKPTECEKGILLPLWKPVGNLSDGDRAARATVYMAAMIYMFLGVSIVADRFMAAIEVITSKEKEIVVKKPNGQTAVVSVRIWNETVSNLTLMALGSSAPEILLSIIEICGRGFKAGDLGPSTIVGSAAFNLFVITALCVYVIPNNETRRIKHLRVFFITASWSIFAYLWLYFIISVSSCGIVEIWEAVLTLLFFPLTVLTAYIADKRIFFYKFLSKKYRSTRNKAVVIQSEGDTEMADGKATSNHIGDDVSFQGTNPEDQEVKEFEQHRLEYIEILRELRKKYPNIDMKTLEERAEFEAVNKGPKSRAFYRIQATRKLTGSGNVIKKAKIEKRTSLQDVKVALKGDEHITKIFFDPGHYTVMENIGTFYLTVSREGGDLNKTIYVDYRTEDGTANAGSDFVFAEGTLVFHPEEVHKQFPVTILDDEIFEEDEHFYVRLSNVRIGDADGLFENSTPPLEFKAQLSNPSLATVMILDDDHPGIFLFEDSEMTVHESCGEANVKVLRSSGARGCVKIRYRTIDGTAKAGRDFEECEGELTFENDESEKMISVPVMDDEEYEKSEVFYLELEEPQLLRRGSGKNNDSGNVPDQEEDSALVELGKPRLGENTKIAVHIQESTEFKNVVDKLLKKANVSLVVGTSSWREQFVEAITVSAGDEDDDSEEAEEKLPSCLDYVMHFLTIFWKVLFAFVPPTDYWGGWACFVISISVIGLLTAVIGDLASGFGCTVGLQDSVTAISFVALGTSVPDTFASKVAAVNDKYADSSIGNVTGSNAVNVFLGIGVAWTIAAVYHASNGDKFHVDPGTLAVSVTVFCVLAFCCMLVLMLRRSKSVGGELGGPVKYKIPTSTFFVFLWLTYLVISGLVAYCHIPSF